MELREPITTKPFVTTVKTVFRLSMSQYFRRFYGLLLWNAIVGLALIVLGFTATGSSSPVLTITIGAIALLIMPLRALSSWFRCRQNARLLEAERTVTFTQDHYKQVDSLGNDTSLAWQMFVRVKVSPDYILLFIDKARFVIVPRTALNPHQTVEVLELLASKGLVK